MNLLHFYGVIAEEVVQAVVLVTAIVAGILPHDRERKDSAVVVEERMEVFVWAATLKHHFDVVFVLSQIWGILLQIDKCTCLDEGVIGETFASTEFDTLVGVEWSGELITVIGVENSSVEINVATDIKVTPFISFNGARNRDKMSLQEDALGDSRVGHFGLKNVNRVIIEVVVDGALAEAVVLIRVLDDGFLEVGREIEYLIKSLNF
jgi:hypothetical protein